MLGSNRGFTIVQLIVTMTVAGLLVIWVGVSVAQRSWRNTQRRHDLGTVDMLVQQYASKHLGQYPSTEAAGDPGSDLRRQFAALGLLDPESGKYYVLGSDFGPCDGSADTTERGPGYISYERPGDGGAPYNLRICLEGGGEYYFGN